MTFNKQAYRSRGFSYLGYFSVVIKDGELWGWGTNSQHQITSEVSDSSIHTPRKLYFKEPTHFVEVAPGYDHMIALTENGEVWSWGANDYGQLGIGTSATMSTTIQGRNAKGEPTKVVLLPKDIISIASGCGHSTALASDGSMFTWGRNDYGQIGKGVIGSTPTPFKVPDLPKIIAIAAGCTHTIALSSDGEIFAWGYNTNGEIGQGHTTHVHKPQRVPGLPTNIVTMSTGYGHTLVLCDDGTLWGWGCNNQGELGIPQPGMVRDARRLSELPSDIAAVACGYNHALALDHNGDVWEWGDNRREPRKITCEGGAVSLIACGRYHSLVKTADRRIYAWGGNTSGELGLGGRTDSSIAVPTLITALEAGNYHWRRDSAWFNYRQIILPWNLVKLNRATIDTVRDPELGNLFIGIFDLPDDLVKKILRFLYN